MENKDMNIISEKISLELGNKNGNLYFCSKMLFL
jgi:hypothetical protein